MLILSPTYQQALKDSGLDTQTYPISTDNSWDSDNLRFDSDLADLSFGDTDFYAVSSLNITLPASISAMKSSTTDISQVKDTSTHIKSHAANSLSIQVNEATAVNTFAAMDTNIQTINYNGNITSDSGTALNSQVTDMTTAIHSDVSTAIESKVIATDSNLKVEGNESEIKTESYVIILR